MRVIVVLDGMQIPKSVSAFSFAEKLNRHGAWCHGLAGTIVVIIQAIRFALRLQSLIS